MAVLLTEFVSEIPSDGECVPIFVDRVLIYKRRWRAVAQNGDEVAVDLEVPLKHKQMLRGRDNIYQVLQKPEEVIVIPIPVDPTVSCKIGWYLGNRHIPVEVRKDVMLMENFPTLEDSLKRIGVHYEVDHDVLGCKPHSEHMH